MSLCLVYFLQLDDMADEIEAQSPGRQGPDFVELGRLGGEGYCWQPVSGQACNPPDPH